MQYIASDGSTKTWNLPSIDPNIEKPLLDRVERDVLHLLCHSISLDFDQAIDRINGREYLSNNQIEQVRKSLGLIHNRTTKSTDARSKAKAND
jgi:hypothetical protein